jgi:hypothetical protein
MVSLFSRSPQLRDTTIVLQSFNHLLSLSLSLVLFVSPFVFLHSNPSFLKVLFFIRNCSFCLPLFNSFSLAPSLSLCNSLHLFVTSFKYLPHFHQFTRFALASYSYSMLRTWTRLSLAILLLPSPVSFDSLPVSCGPHSFFFFFFNSII